jgi:CRP/FNR family transcriptional activator FtrB
MRPGVETLRRLPVFATLSPDGVTRLNEAGDLQRVGPDEHLFDEGECLEHLHILISGFVAMMHAARGKEDVAIDVVGPPAPLCLASAILGLPTAAGARTVSAARLVLVPVSEVIAMLSNEQGMGAAILDFALHDLHSLTTELSDLKTRSSIQRLASFLLGRVTEGDVNPGRFVLPYEKRFVAAKIGCSQENLSRAFAALRRVGVETKGSVVVLRDVSALRALAGILDPIGKGVSP